MQFNVLFQRRLGSDDFKIFYLFQIWEVYLHFSFSIIRSYFEISVINIVIKLILKQYMHLKLLRIKKLMQLKKSVKRSATM